MRQEPGNRPPEPLEGLAPVSRHERSLPDAVDFILVVRRHTNFAPVPPGLERRFVHCVPSLPPIIGAIEVVFSPLISQGVDDVRIGGGHVNADAPDVVTLRQTAAQLGPRPPCIHALMHAAVRAEMVLAIKIAMPRGRVEHMAIAGINDHVDGRGKLIDVQHALPGHAAVNRLEYASLCVGTVLMAYRRHIHDIVVFWIDKHAAYMMRVVQPHVFPGCAGIGGFEDAHAWKCRTGHEHLPGAEPDHVGIGA